MPIPRVVTRRGERGGGGSSVAEATTLQGRYRLNHWLAAGAMGTVYEATDERLNRHVVVKVLKEGLSQDASFVERFRREARAVAALSHPNIASVYDSGEDAGRHFMVMELVKGRDLGRIINEDGALSPDRAADIAAQMCDALAHAHAAGIIHRDVKPANVIVDEGTGQALVTDFGIARAAGDSTLTGTGLVLGTAHYLAPERATGSHTTESSDLYSVGIVLFEMLIGSVPFRGDSVVEVAMQNVSKDVPAPSSIDPSVPSWLDAVVAESTVKDPARRFSDAGRMAAALSRSSEVSPVTPPPSEPSPTGPPQASGVPTEGVATRRPLRKRSVALIAALVSLAVLIGGGVLLAMFADDLFGAGESAAPTGPEESPQGSPDTTRGAGAEPEPEPTTSPEESPSEASPSPDDSPAEDPPAEDDPDGQLVIRDNVIGEDADEVQDVLEEAGYRVTQDQVKSDQPPGAVVDSEPAPGEILTEGQEIILSVSEGP